MNYRILVLAMLLVPSFGHSTSKQEQIKQLENQIHETKVEIAQLNESLAYEAFLAFMGGKDTSVAKPIVKDLRKLQKQLIKLTKELLKLGVKETGQSNSSEVDNCCSSACDINCYEDTKS